MELYLAILKLFLIKDIWSKYKGYIDVTFLKNNYPELYKVFLSYETLFATVEATATVLDLEIAFRIAYPNADQAVFSAIFQRIAETTADAKTVGAYLDSLSQRSAASELAYLALDVAEGKVPVEALLSATATYATKQIEDSAAKLDEDLVSDDLEVLYDSAVKAIGVNWRLKSLRRSLGPLRKGDFGFVFARPETGKTTFLASEVTHMATQVDRPILWINNEEQGEKVALRCYEASLGAPLERILADKPRARSAYHERTKRNIRIFHIPQGSRSTIERLCQDYRPALVVIDQLDKVKGFDADREDLRMGAIYQWARELAKRYSPVIGVSQADGSGEGVKWLTMGNVANAKTAKQAEADWILGIGLSYTDPPNVRGFSICKNKLIGGEESVPGQRHGHWDVLLEPEIGRYADIAK